MTGNSNHSDATPTTLTIGQLVAEPGAKVQGFLRVHGSDLEMPLTLVNGTRPGKTVVITAGIHGGEYPGVEASIRLAAHQVCAVPSSSTP
ncbi:MAG: hypothetical protein WCL50_11110, partial [Spirochaetota bacterium]